MATHCMVIEPLKADVLKYYTHLGKSISGRGAGIILTKKVTESQLRNFGKVYCEVLNSIYAKNGKSWQIGRVQQSPMFTIYQFGFEKNSSLNYSYSHEPDDSIKDLLHNKISTSY